MLILTTIELFIQYKILISILDYTALFLLYVSSIFILLKYTYNLVFKTYKENKKIINKIIKKLIKSILKNIGKKIIKFANNL